MLVGLGWSGNMEGCQQHQHLAVFAVAILIFTESVHIRGFAVTLLVALKAPAVLFANELTLDDVVVVQVLTAQQRKSKFFDSFDIAVVLIKKMLFKDTDLLTPETN